MKILILSLLFVSCAKLKFNQEKKFNLGLYVGKHAQGPYCGAKVRAPNCIQMLERMGNIIPPAEEISGLKYPNAQGLNAVKYKEVVKKSLKDPESAKIRNLSKPFNFWGSAGPGKTKPMKAMCAEVNAKNSFGAYSGFSKMMVVKRPNGSISLFPLRGGATVFIWASKRFPCH